MNALERMRARIAEWYGAEWNSQDDKFYETDDGGVCDDEDEGAMHAYRAAKWALEFPTTTDLERQVAEKIEEHYDEEVYLPRYNEAGALVTSNAARAVVKLFGPEARPIELNHAAVDEALRRVIEHIDYDLHKEIERDEETGEDTYSEHVERFVAEYNKAAGNG